jgi:hypothetical protein
MLAGTVGAAIKFAIANLHPVTDNHTATMGALGRKGMDRTFETVKHMFLSTDHHGKSLVILISTDFTPGHISSFLLETNLIKAVAFVR